jgi:dTDP-glucose 4,6-dehydratase
MTDRFLVIGSNSFSGAYFIQNLLEQGFEVIGVSRSKELNSVFLPYKWRVNSKAQFQYHQIDLNHDLDQLVSLLKTHKPAYIINFAAQGMVAQSWDIPEHWYQTNVLAQVKLHDQLRQLDFLKKYVHVSTPEAYGSTSGWIKEDFNFAPSTPYAVSRAACDLHLMSFYKAYNFPVVFTRAANVYGPGQQLYRIIPRALLYARTGQKMQLHGGGHSIRSFIHMSDVADATLRIAKNGRIGETYHISTKETTSISALVEQVCELTKTPFESLVEVTEDRLGKDQAYLLDSTKLRDELGWADRISLKQGIDETLNWIDQNMNELQKLPHDYQHKA